jgi:hypothetical protein
MWVGIGWRVGKMVELEADMAVVAEELEVGIVIVVGGLAVRMVDIVLGILAEVEMTAESVVFEMGPDIVVLEMHLDIPAALDLVPEMYK